MDNLIQGLPHVTRYSSDRGNRKEHLEEVLKRLADAGFRLKREEKCEFMVSSVKYFRHQINAAGLQPTAEKNKAITNAPAPRMQES